MAATPGRTGIPVRTTRAPSGAGLARSIASPRLMASDRSTAGFTQMGGEGVPWVGQQAFSNDQHIFANIGDGTYFHSGLLAIRQSVAAGINITYKILYNDAVAMTGGQPVDGTLRVPDMTRELQAEGVRDIAIVTDEPGQYEGVEGLAQGVTVHHRDELDAVQQRMRQKLRSPAGRAVYGQRKATVEPVLGVLKQQRGMRQFRTRGLAKVAVEFTLAALAYDLAHLHALSRR